MNLGYFALLFQVLLAVSVNEKNQGRSTTGDSRRGLRIPNSYTPNLEDSGRGLRIPNSYTPNLEDSRRGLRIPGSYKPNFEDNTSDSSVGSESNDYNIESDKESSSDESKTYRRPLDRTYRLRSTRDPSVKRARPAHATRSATKSAAKKDIKIPKPGHIENLRIILAGKKLGVSKKSSKPVSTATVHVRRRNLVNAVRYLLQPVLEVTSIRSKGEDMDLLSLAELARTELLQFQESRKGQDQLSAIVDWVYEKVPDNNQFCTGPNIEGIISLINTGKWVNMRNPDEPHQTYFAICNRRQAAEGSLTAFLKLAPEFRTGNDLHALKKVKPELEEIAQKLPGNKKYNSLEVIRIWCNEHLPYQK